MGFLSAVQLRAFAEPLPVLRTPAGGPRAGCKLCTWVQAFGRPEPLPLQRGSHVSRNRLPGRSPVLPLNSCVALSRRLGLAVPWGHEKDPRCRQSEPRQARAPRGLSSSPAQDVSLLPSSRRLPGLHRGYGAPSSRRNTKSEVGFRGRRGQAPYAERVTQHKCIFSPFWRPEVQDRAVGRASAGPRSLRRPSGRIRAGPLSRLLVASWLVAAELHLALGILPACAPVSEPPPLLLDQSRWNRGYPAPG